MDLHAFFWRVFGQCRGISFKLSKNSGKAAVAVSDGQEATFTCTKAHQRSQSGFVDNSTERARHQETERLRDVVLRPRSNNTTGASQTVLVSLVETQLNNAACVCVCVSLNWRPQLPDSLSVINSSCLNVQLQSI